MLLQVIYQHCIVHICFDAHITSSCTAQLLHYVTPLNAQHQYMTKHVHKQPLSPLYSQTMHDPEPRSSRRTNQNPADTTNRVLPDSEESFVDLKTRAIVTCRFNPASAATLPDIQESFANIRLSEIQQSLSHHRSSLHLTKQDHKFTCRYHQDPAAMAKGDMPESAESFWICK